MTREPESTEGNAGKRKGHFKCSVCGMWTPYRDMHTVTEENETFASYFPGEKLCPEDAKHSGIW